jgi:serralysin
VAFDPELTPVDSGSSFVVPTGAPSASASVASDGLAAGSSLDNATGAYTVVTVADGGMTINLEFVNADHPTASFEADIEKAAGILSTDIRNKITVNLSIGYGELDGQRLTNGEAEGGVDGGALDSYSTVRSDLINAGALGAKTLPTESSINGQSSVAVWSAQEKLFGQLSPTASGLDGSAGFATDIQTITGKDVLVGVALHELTHALGRLPYGPQPDIFDFFRFTSPGHRLFSDAIPAPAAYFSINGGVTAIADYGVNSDPSDFLNPYDSPPSNLTPEDPFDEYYDAKTRQTLTGVDMKQLRVLGFDVSKPAPNDLFADNLLNNLGDGNVAEFAMNNGTPGWEAHGSAAAAWQVAGAGDFFGNGAADNLFRDSNTGAAGLLRAYGTAGWQAI